MRILVVHRQKSIANDLKKLFNSVGWSVQLAHSGLDGLQAACSEGYRMIVTAIDLPVITGIEMVRAIRNFSFNMKTTICFTDKAESASYLQIFNKLNAKFLPTKTEDLMQLVDSSLNDSNVWKITNQKNPNM